MLPFRRRNKQPGVVSLTVVLLLAACARGVRMRHLALNSVGFIPLRCAALAGFISAVQTEGQPRVLKSLTLQLEPKCKRGCMRMTMWPCKCVKRRGALGPNPEVRHMQQTAGVVHQVPPIGPSRCRWQDIP